jgi:hypothetical protein
MNHRLFLNLYQIFTLVKDFEQGCFGNSGLALQEWPPSRSLPYTKAPRPAPYVLNQTSQPSPTQGFRFQFFYIKNLKKKKKPPTKKTTKKLVAFTLKLFFFKSPIFPQLF